MTITGSPLRGELSAKLTEGSSGGFATVVFLCKTLKQVGMVAVIPTFSSLWVYLDFEGLICPLSEVYFHFEGLLIH